MYHALPDPRKSVASIWKHLKKKMDHTLAHNLTYILNPYSNHMAEYTRAHDLRIE